MRQKGKPKVSSRPSPWWLGEGEEECPNCGLRYIYELEYRCVACDGPSCPHCKQTAADLHVVCANCVGDIEGS